MRDGERYRVRRAGRGRLTDAAGKVLTGPAPSLPYRARARAAADKPAVSWRDSRAVWAGEERNPAAEHVPELDRRDLLRLFYGDDAPVGADPVTLAKATHETRRMLRKHFAGFVVLEERTRGRELEAIRILQPRPDGDE